MVIQVYVSRADYDFTGVVLCGGEPACEFGHMVVVHDSDGGADFAFGASPAFAGDVFAHEIADGLRAVRPVFGVIAALKF